MEAAVESNLTPCELERGKLLPDLIHANLVLERRLAEPSLAIEPVGTTPDLAVYPPLTLNYDNRPARRSQPPRCGSEIQSQSQSLGELVAKVKIHFQFGVQSRWPRQPAVPGSFILEHPEHYACSRANDTLRAAALPLELPLTPVFA